VAAQVHVGYSILHLKEATGYAFYIYEKKTFYSLRKGKSKEEKGH